MKKLKLFFVAAAMLLISIGVFAGRNYFSSTSLYAASTSLVGVYYPLTSSGTWEDISFSGGANAVTITDANGTTFDLVAPNGVPGNYSSVFPLGW